MHQCLGGGWYFSYQIYHCLPSLHHWHLSLLGSERQSLSIQFKLFSTPHSSTVLSRYKWSGAPTGLHPECPLSKVDQFLLVLEFLYLLAPFEIGYSEGQISAHLKEFSANMCYSRCSNRPIWCLKLVLLIFLKWACILLNNFTGSIQSLNKIVWLETSMNFHQMALLRTDKILQ